MTRLLPAVLIGACIFAVAWAARAPLWLAVVCGVAVAVFVWHRTP